MGQLRAGVGRVWLTPAIGTWLVGFAGRTEGCTSIRDDLSATALVFDDGANEVAIISCDLLSLHPDLVRATRTLVEESTGIPAANVMLCCTHTHSGPPGYAGAGARPIDQAHAASLPYRIAGAVRLAADRRAPARVGHGRGRARIAINRREVVGEGQTILGENPDGPVDDAVDLLRIEFADGTPCATLVNYACHPVIIGPRSLQVSADWVGYARQAFEAAIGTHMLFVQGACADLNPLGGVQSDYANCERLGGEFAEEVLRVYNATVAEQDDVRLAVASDTLTVPTAPLASGATPVGGPNIVQRRLDEEFPWARDGNDQGVHLAVQGIAVGDVALVGMACEPFTQTGLEIKRRSPYGTTLVAGYTNGCMGYVPPADAYEHGGYEVLTAHQFYRVPDPVDPCAEQMLVRGCLDVLNRMRGS